MYCDSSRCRPLSWRAVLAFLPARFEFPPEEKCQPESGYRVISAQLNTIRSQNSADEYWGNGKGERFPGRALDSKGFATPLWRDVFRRFRRLLAWCVWRLWGSPVNAGLLKQECKLLGEKAVSHGQTLIEKAVSQTINANRTKSNLKYERVSEGHVNAIQLQAIANQMQSDVPIMINIWWTACR